MATWRRFVFVVLGVLLGYLVATAVSLFVGVMLFEEMPSTENGQVQFWVNGIILLAGIFTGGVAGSWVGRKSTPAEDEGGFVARTHRPMASHASSDTQGRPTGGGNDERGPPLSERVPGRYDWDGWNWSIAPTLPDKRRARLAPWVVLGHVLFAAGATMVGYAVGVYSSSGPDYDFQTGIWNETDDQWILGMVSGGIVAFVGIVLLLVSAFSKRARKAEGAFNELD